MGEEVEKLITELRKRADAAETGRGCFEPEPFREAADTLERVERERDYWRDYADWTMEVEKGSFISTARRECQAAEAQVDAMQADLSGKVVMSLEAFNELKATGAQVEALRKVAEAVDQAAHGGADTIALLLELNCIGKMARAALTAAATPAEESSVEAEDGLDTPLPCDVQIAHIRYRKGVKLRTLVNAAARWHALASAACPLPAAPAEARTGQPEGEA